MKGCRSVQGRLAAYLDRELDPRRERWVEDHVGICPACQRELNQLRRTTLLLRSLPFPSRAEEDWQEALRAFRGKIEARHRPPRFPFLRPCQALLEDPLLVLAPTILFLLALVDALTLLDLEEEALAWFSSYLLPFLLG